MAPTEMPTVADSADLHEQLRAAIDLLQRIADDWRLLDRLTAEDRRRFHQAIARLSEPDPRAKRKRQKADKAASVRRGEAVLNQTGIRTLRRRPVVTTPNVFPPEHFEAHDVDYEAPARNEVSRTANGPRRERRPATRERRTPNLRPRLLHLQGDLHARPRLLRSALPRLRRCQFRRAHGARGLARPCRARHRRARQIGYQAGLKLLRSGAHLIVTTRFPRNAAARYAQEADFGDWGHRLEIFGLDLRDPPSVEAFCRDLVASRERLDFIVNNACQTVRRPPILRAHDGGRTDGAARPAGPRGTAAGPARIRRIK